jgi:hypothetical protein
MAFTRKFLKALGIEDAAIDQIIESHTEVVDALKEQIKTLSDKADTAADLQKKLDEGSDEWKTKYDDVKKQFDDYKADQSKKDTRRAKETALAKVASEAGITEKRIQAILKVVDVDKYEIDDDGELKDKDGAKSYFETEWADFIGKSGKKGADTSTPPGNKGKEKAWGDMTLDEKMRLKHEDPERYEQLKKG